jgi:hypothetical protein
LYNSNFGLFLKSKPVLTEGEIEVDL